MSRTIYRVRYWDESDSSNKPSLDEEYTLSGKDDNTGITVGLGICFQRGFCPGEKVKVQRRIAGKSFHRLSWETVYETDSSGCQVI